MPVGGVAALGGGAVRGLIEELYDEAGLREQVDLYRSLMLQQLTTENAMAKKRSDKVYRYEQRDGMESIVLPRDTCQHEHPERYEVRADQGDLPCVACIKASAEILRAHRSQEQILRNGGASDYNKDSFDGEEYQ